MKSPEEILREFLDLASPPNVDIEVVKKELPGMFELLNESREELKGLYFHFLVGLGKVKTLLWRCDHFEALEPTPEKRIEKFLKRVYCCHYRKERQDSMAFTKTLEQVLTYLWNILEGVADRISFISYADTGGRLLPVCARNEETYILTFSPVLFTQDQYPTVEGTIFHELAHLLLCLWSDVDSEDNARMLGSFLKTEMEHQQELEIST